MSVETRAELLSDVILHGSLGERFGRHHRLALANPREAFAALEHLHPGFQSSLVADALRGVSIRLIVDGEETTEANAKSLAWKAAGGSGFRVEMIPVPTGSEFIIAEILFTIYMIAYTYPWVIPLLLSLGFGLYNALSAPKPMSSKEGKDEEGAGFSGSVNVASEGVPVPILYGEHMTGSLVVSAGVKNAGIVDPPKGSNSGDWGLGWVVGGGGGNTIKFTHPLDRDQRIVILDVVSEGPIEGFSGDPLDKVFFDEVSMRDYEDVDHDFRHGEWDQTAMGAWSTSERIEPVSVELKKDQEITRTIWPPAAMIRINIAILGLVRMDKKDGPENGPMHLKMTVTDQSGTGWVDYIEIDESAKVLSRRNLSQEVKLQGAGPWLVEVVKLSDDNKNNLTSQIFFDSIVAVGDKQLSYPYTALQGVSFLASKHANIPRRNYVLRGRKVRVPSNYDPTTRVYTEPWDGTFAAEEQWTNNPAWILLDFLTHKRYGLGNYIPTALVNVWSFYRAGQRCDEDVSDGKIGTEPRYTFNSYLYQESESISLAQEIAASMEATIYWDGAQLSLMQDRPEEATYAFNEANVKDGLFSYVDQPMRSTHNRVVVEWTDPSDFYRERLERLDNRVGITKHGVRESRIKALGCTSRGLARRHGIAILEAEKLGDSVKFTTGLEGLAIQPGAVFTLTDPYRYAETSAGRTLQVTATTAALDQEVTLDAGVTYTIELLLDDRVEVLSQPGNATSIPLAQAPAGDDYRLVSVWMDEDEDGSYETKREPSGYAAGTLTLAQYEGPSGNVPYRVVYPGGLHRGTVTTAAGATRHVEWTEAAPSVPAAGGVWCLWKPSQVAKPFRCISRTQGDDYGTFEVDAIPYDEDKYARIDAAVDVRDPDPGDLPPWLQGITPPPPIDVQTSIEIRRFEAQVVPAIVVSWADPDPALPGATAIGSYRVQWRHESDDKYTTVAVKGNSYAIPALQFGLYDIRVASEQVFTGRLSSTVIVSLLLGLDDVPQLGMRVTGLTVRGRIDNQWTGPDLVLEWRLNFEGAMELGGETSGQPPDSVTPDNLFEGYVLQLRDGETLDLIGEEMRHVGAAPTWRYSISENADEGDGRPRRSLLARVAGRDTLGRLSPWEEIRVENGTPELPTLVSAPQAVGASIYLKLATAARDPDFAGYMVWVSETQGFVTDENTLVFKGLVDGPIRIPVGENADYYLRFAAYDRFSDSPLDLDVSEELGPISVGFVADPQFIVDNAIIGTAQIAELSATKISGGTLDVDVIAAKTLRAEKMAIGSLDNLIFDPLFDVPKVPASVTESYDTDGGGGSGGWAWETTLQRSGMRCPKFSYAGDEVSPARIYLNTIDRNAQGDIRIGPGDTFLFECWVRYTGASPYTPGPVRCGVEFRAINGAVLDTVYGDPGGDTTTWEQVFVVTPEAPDLATYVEFFVEAAPGEINGTVMILAQPYARRLINTTTVAADAITDVFVAESFEQDVLELTVDGAPRFLLIGKGEVGSGTPSVHLKLQHRWLPWPVEAWEDIDTANFQINGDSNLNAYKCVLVVSKEVFQAGKYRLFIESYYASYEFRLIALALKR